MRVYERHIRKKLLAAANTAPSVTDAATQAQAFAALSDIKAWTKDVESARVEVKEPVLKATRKIDSMAKEYCAPLLEAATMLDRMLSAYHDEQKRLLEEEQQRKDEEIALQKQIEEDAVWEAEQEARMLNLKGDSATDEDLQRAVNAEEDAKMATQRTLATLRNPVITTPTRQAGMVVRKVVRWEITDEKKLFAAAPHFFRLEPNKAVITASVTEKTKIDGLKVWAETKTGARV